MILLTEVYKLNEHATRGQKEFSLREVLINPEHIFMLREDKKMSERQEEGLLPSDLDERQKFTRVHFSTVNNSAITVVGETVLTSNKLRGA